MLYSYNNNFVAIYYTLNYNIPTLRTTIRRCAHHFLFLPIQSGSTSSLTLS